MLDDLIPTWKYVEGDDMAEYYPQYYHKTDKVSASPPPALSWP